MNPTPSPVVKIVLRHGLGNDLHIGTHMFWSYSGGTPTVANLNALAGTVGTAWNTNLASLLSSNGLLEGVDILDVASNTGVEGTSSTTHAGTRAGSEVSLGASLVALYKIARHYRGGKPKGFWPFGITSDLTGGAAWSAGFITACNSGLAAFASAVNGATNGAITLGVQQNVSYFQGSQTNPSGSKWGRRNVPAPRAVPLVEPVTAIVASPVLGSQRRRIRAS